MNERVTFISVFNDIIKKIEHYVKGINDKLCKIPFEKNVNSCEETDTFPYHFILSALDICCEEKVIEDR